jgi:hypothetical protein
MYSSRIHFAHEYCPFAMDAPTTDQKKKSKGWDGEELELEHQKERMMMLQMNQSTERGRGEGGAIHGTNYSVAVDLNQFRNTEVGTGFQAKHVIRQPTATMLPATVASPSTNRNMMMMMMMMRDNDIGSNNINSTLSVSHDKSETSKAAASRLTKEELLRNDHLRQFRKEIEKILSSST